MRYKKDMSERDGALLQSYIDVLKKHGDYAKVMPKHELYREAAEGFFISTDRACRIILRMLKLSNINTDVIGNQETRELLNKIKGTRNDN